MFVSRRASVVAVAAATVFVATDAVQADTIVTGTYQLHNHPDGAAQPPLYGFRLDELFDVTGGHDIFTFDFDHASSQMYLAYNGTSIHIYGQAFGGLDTGNTYGNAAYTGVAQIDFWYTVGVGLAGGDDDLIVSAAPGVNTGTITFLGSTINLFDSPMGGYSFRFGDTDDDNGHRGFNGISGWGWVDHHVQGQHIASSDWLFTAQLIPLPPAALLGVAGLGLVAAVRRRRNKTTA